MKYVKFAFAYAVALGFGLTVGAALGVVSVILAVVTL